MYNTGNVYTSNNKRHFKIIFLFQLCSKPLVDLGKNQRIVIIGSDPTGLGAAHRLCELGVMNSNTQVIVLEQEAIQADYYLLNGRVDGSAGTKGGPEIINTRNQEYATAI